jgi:C4-dicarboxylate-specific signal transduction histidine kinase
VLGHAESLVKVLGNLMENSLDACGGPEALRLRVGWQVDGRTVTLLWEDNGPGLPADIAERLFDPYFSTKSRGTGLGLAICRNLLDKMGGTITLSSRADGDGAVARVTLPRADVPAAPAATVGEPPDEE